MLGVSVSVTKVEDRKIYDYDLFIFRSLLLASHSLLFRSILSDVLSNADDITVVTNICSNHLKIIAKFALTGTVENIVEDEFKWLSETFKCLGIDLNYLSFSKELVSKEEKIDEGDLNLEDVTDFMFDREKVKPKR